MTSLFLFFRLPFLLLSLSPLSKKKKKTSPKPFSTRSPLAIPSRTGPRPSTPSSRNSTTRSPRGRATKTTTTTAPSPSSRARSRRHSSAARSTATGRRASSAAASATRTCSTATATFAGSGSRRTAGRSSSGRGLSRRGKYFEFFFLLHFSHDFRSAFLPICSSLSLCALSSSSYTLIRLMQDTKTKQNSELVAEEYADRILFRSTFGTARAGGPLANAFDFRLKNPANTNVVREFCVPLCVPL